MKFRKKAFLGSIFLIFVGLTAFFIRGNRIYGIDFLGGDELSFTYTHPIDHEAIHSVAKSHRLGEVGSVYQKHFAEGKTVHFLKIQTEWGRGMEVLKVLREQFPESNLELISQNTIGSSVSREVQHNVFVSIGVALVGMLLYIAFRFEFGYGVGAIVALIHDTLITVGLYILWGRQFSAPMIAAILMVIGYSINDTIVIFDRIREELSLNPHKTLYQVINISINETLSRTFFTSLTTFFPAGIMAFYCSGVVRDYSLVFAMGVFVGTFSSIFIASPLFYAWHRGSRKNVEAIRDTSPVYEWMKE
jgi:SecD/SecF fusion protein